MVELTKECTHELTVGICVQIERLQLALMLAAADVSRIEEMGYDQRVPPAILNALMDLREQLKKAASDD